MDLIEEVEAVRIQLGLTKTDVSKTLGAPTPQNYNNWVYRGSMPKNYFPVAQKFLEDNQNNATRGLSTSFGDSNVTHAPPVKKMIPVISWVQAGEFCESNVLELHDVEEWLPCPANASDKAFGLRVKGDSMTSSHSGDRSYPEGIVIYVDPEVDVTSGRRVIAKSATSDEATFKTYVEDDGLKFLKPINPQFPMKEMTADVHICGVVIGSYWPE
jgi:SOS-response transcriptional repressor LexA